jgi:hypothetical protein
MSRNLRRVRRFGLVLAMVTGLLVSIWNGPEAYETGCYHWLRISKESEVIAFICQYTAAE